MTATRTLLTGADLVLPDRVATNHTLVIDEGRIVEISDARRTAAPGERCIDLSGDTIVPGFIDVHVHGVLGTDVQDGRGAIARVGAVLPRFGVTAFCPTTIACLPRDLAGVLEEVRDLRAAKPARSSRVLGAHLESNFISPEYCGAQPVACLRTPPPIVSSTQPDDEILRTVFEHRPDVVIMTIAPELENGIELVRWLVAAGIIVSIGHSGASYEMSLAAIAAGATQATHLFNRMTPMTHRSPGMVGAVLSSDSVTAELICDGHHVHPAVMRSAIAAKGASRIMAITDGTAGSGLPAGAKATLGGRVITVEEVARLDDRTMAGSVLTMDQAFRSLVGKAGASVIDAVRMCSTTPARALGLTSQGVLAPGALADFAVLDSTLAVRQTWIDGLPVFGDLSTSL